MKITVVRSIHIKCESGEHHQCPSFDEIDGNLRWLCVCSCHKQDHRDRAVKRAYQKAEVEAMYIEQAKESHEKNLRAVNDVLQKFEEEWLETHDCSCELLNLPCAHEKETE